MGGWTVADGAEQEMGHVLCGHVLCPAEAAVRSLVLVRQGNPLFHPNLTSVCLHRATFSLQSETKCLNVVCSQQPSVDAKWVDGAKPLFKIRLHLDSTIYTQVNEHLAVQVFQDKGSDCSISAAAVGKRYLCLQSSTEILLQQQVWDCLQGSAALSGCDEQLCEGAGERLMFSWPIAL